ncbi:MAG: translation initiation factor IF-3 [Lentisphaerae bacterium]|nr:translation initiation factor IF-3 [Lentisphaerota bacterium]
MPQVRCISDAGEQIGILPTGEALKLALSQNLDLVEISPNANPPVCRIMNFGKYRYEESRRDKEARKHQIHSMLKEMKFHANVEDHDYLTKANHIREFLQKGHRVKASLLFRGRENEHREIGYNLFNRLIKDLADIGAPESPPRLFGNNLVMLLHAQRGKTAGHAPAPVKPPKPVAPPPIPNPPANPPMSSS